MAIQHLNENVRDKTEKSGELKIVRKYIGSIIERPAVFSACGKNIFIVRGNSIRSYNVETGELVTVYYGLTKDAVGVALHLSNSDKLIAVSRVGEVIEWEQTSRGSYVRKIELGDNDGQLLVQSFFLVLQEDNEILCVTCAASVQDQAYLKSFCYVSGKERNFFPEIRVDNHHQSVAVRHADRETLIAAFCNEPKTTLTFCISYNGSETKIKKAESQNRITCVACHPSELCVITGDITGCVRLWKNLLGEPVWTPYHWHTLPVKTLVFSDTGSCFFSGGGECVLVRWTLESTKTYLPRLASEIAHVAVSPGNTYLAISTEDNGIQMVNASFKVFRTIQHFSWSSSPSGGTRETPIEVTTDPRTKLVVSNGRVGHLQFFSVDQESLLFLLDVVGHNYLTQERFKIIKNTEVVKFAFSSDGNWLATVEFCENESKAPMELRLKFWEYNKIQQRYVLNTSVENPHRDKVNAIQFRPSTNNDTLMCVTTGDDLKFRTWSLVETTGIYRKGCVWNSENVGFYRNLPIQALSFSSDGSLMAAAFGPTLTIWVPGSNQLKCSLTRPDSVEYLSHVEFGRKSCAHLVITGSKFGIAVWNLLSVSLLWVVRFNLTILVSDPVLDTVAAFSDNNDVVIFFPNCLDPVFRQNCLISSNDSKIVNAVFVPLTRKKNSNMPWQSESQLCFFTSKQELFCLEYLTSLGETEGRNLDSLPGDSFRPKTAYAALLAQQSESDVIDKKKELHKHLGVPGFKTLRELVDAPAHAVPPLSLVGYSLLLSFISKSDTGSDNLRSRFRKPEPENEVDDNEDSDEGSKEEQSPTSRIEERKQDLLVKLQFKETPSSLVDSEKSLIHIQKQPLDWVSNLLI